MSEAISPSTGKRYGVARTCAAWGRKRSSFYAKTCPRSCRNEEKPTQGRKKPGPKTEVSDFELLALIREDISSSPFTGEGHRKVWARLRFRQAIPVARKRVLRVMREANLLSPHRVPQRPPQGHTGRIVEGEPNVMFMWGRGGAKVFTTYDGWGWIFACLEHWNAEVMGWHVRKTRRPLRGM